MLESLFNKTPILRNDWFYHLRSNLLRAVDAVPHNGLLRLLQLPSNVLKLAPNRKPEQSGSFKLSLHLEASTTRFNVPEETIFAVGRWMIIGAFSSMLIGSKISF